MRGHKRLGLGFVESGGGFGMSKGTKVWVKNPFCPKTSRMDRYTLVVYRYTLATAFFCVGCTGTLGGCTGTL